MAAQTFKIAAIPADGVGKEVVAAGRRVLDTLAAQSEGKFAFAWEEFPWGSEYYEQTGKMMADDGLDTLKRASTPSTSARWAGTTCPTTSACGVCG